MAETDQRNARANRRLKTFQPAEVSFGATRVRAHILDLSTSGARVHAAAVPDLTQFVTLSLGPLTTVGRAVWVRDSRFGLQFLTPLSDADVAALVG